MITIKRQNDVIFTDDGRRIYVCDSACQKANIAKWSVFLGLFFIIFLWLTVGYLHARRRVRKGMKPMLYHRWLAPKQYRQNNAAFYHQQQGPPAGFYGMQTYPEPPPMYNPAGMPPAYMPPPGSTKATPEQNRGVPPPPPPPPAAPAQGTGAPQLPPITQ